MEENQNKEWSAEIAKKNILKWDFNVRDWHTWFYIGLTVLIVLGGLSYYYEMQTMNNLLKDPCIQMCIKANWTG